MAKECEAKIKVDDLKALRTRLKNLGALDKGRCLERNWVLDDAKGSMRKQGVLLRVRSTGDAGGILTI